MLFRVDQPTAHWARTVLAQEINHIQFEIWRAKDFKQFSRVSTLKSRKRRVENAIRLIKQGYMNISAVKLVRNGASGQITNATVRDVNRVASRVSNLKKFVEREVKFTRLNRAMNRIASA